jgi:hypothetical protein
MKTVLVTPSYLPDLQRCELMLQSAEKHVSGMAAHYLIVDQTDMPYFGHLRSRHVTLVAKEELLPGWIKKAPWTSKWWISARTMPVRGWILQQVIKLAVAEHIDADAYCYADSDIAFIRSFDAHTLWQGDRLRFQRETRRGEMLESRRYKNWYGMAARYCNLPDQSAIKGAYIAQLNTMGRTAMLLLMRHLELVEGRSWMEVLLGTWDFSEYILYGAFVEHVLGYQGHFIPPKLLCHSSWYHDITHLKDLPAFMDLIDDDHVAIHIQSNLKIDSEDYRHLIP